MSSDFISRIIGMVSFSVGGLFLGVRLAELGGSSAYLYGTTFLLVGALAGLVLTPYLTIRPLRSLRHQLRHIPARQLLAGTVGLVVGLIIAALMAFPLSLMPSPFNQ
ncbi:MAG: PIN domain nuclease, partial [Anaerolineae bacterium]